MSRVGSRPVKIPAGVKVQEEGQRVLVTGSKGSVSVPLHPLVKCDISPEEVRCSIENASSIEAKAMWGTTQSLISGAIDGVSEGVSKSLELKGVGFRAAVKGNVLEMNIGFSVPTTFDIPAGVTITCPTQTEVIVSGCDKQVVGHVAACIRKLRPVEPYKGKGIRYKGEFVRMKEGKKK